MEDITSGAISKAASGLLYTAGAALGALILKCVLMPVWTAAMKRRRLVAEAHALSTGVQVSNDAAPLPPFLHSWPLLRHAIRSIGALIGGLFRLIGGLIVLSICVGLYVQGPWYLRIIFGTILASLVLLNASFMQLLRASDPNDQTQWRSTRERTAIYWSVVTIMLFLVLVLPFIIAHFDPPPDFSNDP